MSHQYACRSIQGGIWGKLRSVLFLVPVFNLQSYSLLRCDLFLVSGHSILFIDALRTLEQSFEWKLQLLLVCDHDRPIPVFKPSVLLVQELEPNISHAVWPIPILKRGRPTKTSGAGRGRGVAKAVPGRRGAGRGREAGRGRGRGGADAEPIPLENGAIEYDEAAEESDLGSEPPSSARSSSYEQIDSEED